METDTDVQGEGRVRAPARCLPALELTLAWGCGRGETSKGA
jgi:hypothetical protein